jgi:hypothetical protein
VLDLLPAAGRAAAPYAGSSRRRAADAGHRHRPLLLTNCSLVRCSASRPTGCPVRLVRHSRRCVSPHARPRLRAVSSSQALTWRSRSPDEIVAVHGQCCRCTGCPHRTPSARPATASAAARAWNVPCTRTGATGCWLMTRHLSGRRSPRRLGRRDCGLPAARADARGYDCVPRRPPRGISSPLGGLVASHAVSCHPAQGHRHYRQALLLLRLGTRAGPSCAARLPHRRRTARLPSAPAQFPRAELQGHLSLPWGSSFLGYRTPAVPLPRQPLDSLTQLTAFSELLPSGRAAAWTWETFTSSPDEPARALIVTTLRCRAAAVSPPFARTVRWPRCLLGAAVCLVAAAALWATWDTRDFVDGTCAEQALLFRAPPPTCPHPPTRSTEPCPPRLNRRGALVVPVS